MVFYDDKELLKVSLYLLSNLSRKNKDLVSFQNNYLWGFPGGSVVKNPPANVEDTGLTPGQGRFHVMEQLSPCATTTEPVLWSPQASVTEAPVPYRPCSATREATAMRSPCTTTREGSLAESQS